MKKIKCLFLLSLLLTTTSFAKIQVPKQQKDIVSFAAKTTGKTYQLAKRCGADSVKVEQYRTQIITDAKRKNTSQRQEINFAKIFQDGIKEGNYLFDSLPTIARNKTNICSQAIAIVESRIQKNRNSSSIFKKNQSLSVITFI